MSSQTHPIYLFEHESFKDLADAVRRCKLYGFEYRADHPKYRLFCEALRSKVSDELLTGSLTRSLESLPDNSALYILALTDSGRADLWPTLLEVALSHGFCVLDENLAQCHTTAGVWTESGFQARSQR